MNEARSSFRSCWRSPFNLLAAALNLSKGTKSKLTDQEMRMLREVFMKLFMNILMRSSPDRPEIQRIQVCTIHVLANQRVILLLEITQVGDPKKQSVHSVTFEEPVISADRSESKADVKSTSCEHEFGQPHS